MNRQGSVLVSMTVVALATACGKGEVPAVKEAAAAEVSATTYVVHDTTVANVIDASGPAEPMQQATLSTKIMGSVNAVFVKEGDHVAAGAILVQIDARDIDAKADQVRAGIAAAEAAQHEAELMATRMRALYADSAAPKAQLDAAEAGLARATAAVAAARAGESELGALASYSTVRAPFSGVVTQRFVDPGAFAAPGAPLLTIQDQSRIRVAATAAPSEVRGLRRGAGVDVRVEGVPAKGVVEGVVPTAGSLMTINVVVDNRGGQLTTGGAASVALGTGTRTVRLVPSRAVVHQGDLTGLRIKRGAATNLRWVRVGRSYGDFVEVSGGLESGAVVLVPASITPES